jgi:hypothetical protein
MISSVLNVTRGKEVTERTKTIWFVVCRIEIIVYIDEKLMKSRPFPRLKLEIRLRTSSYARL